MMRVRLSIDESARPRKALERARGQSVRARSGAYMHVTWRRGRCWEPALDLEAIHRPGSESVTCARLLWQRCSPPATTTVHRLTRATRSLPRAAADCYGSRDRTLSDRHCQPATACGHPNGRPLCVARPALRASQCASAARHCRCPTPNADSKRRGWAQASTAAQPQPRGVSSQLVSTPDQIQTEMWRENIASLSPCNHRVLLASACCSEVRVAAACESLRSCGHPC